MAETNLLGTGMTLGGAAAFASDQLAMRLRFLEPAFVGTPWMLSASLLFNRARDFFGNAGTLYDDRSSPDVTRFALVRYDRFGGSVGVGHDLGLSTQLWVHQRLETIDASAPREASHLRGGVRTPIDFSILRGQSVLSTLRATFQYDSRDKPLLTTSGVLATVSGEIALGPLGSDYDYQRVDLRVAQWTRLPWDHSLKLEAFAGAITGYAPFFEQYYVNDFCDFLATRLLGLNFDRRPPPNFLGNAIGEVRRGQYALKVGAEYRIPLYRGARSVYGIDLFASAGAYLLASKEDLDDPVQNYSGAARIPVDLTGNAGVRMDTSAGGFSFAFSSLLGFMPIRREAVP